MPTRNLTTKDDVSLRELLDRAERRVEYFNEDADFIFRDLFVEEVSQQHFTQLPDGEFEWEELAEGEHPKTAEYDDQLRMAISVSKFGRALGFTQEFINDHDSEQVQKRMMRLIEGAMELQQDQIMSVIDDGIADGSQLWYEPKDYGDYSFSRTHNHTFTSTGALFPDSNPHTPSEHIEEAADEIKHHPNAGSNLIGLVSSGFKRSLRDEITWDAQYRIPMADGLRSEDIRNVDVSIDGVDIVQTPWLTGNSFYVVDAGGEKPVKMHEKRPVQITRPSGGQVSDPGELIGASGSGRWGFRMADPLGAVKVEPDDLS